MKTLVVFAVLTLFCQPVCLCTNVTDETGHIKTHGSESRGQEEAGLRDERVSYLQVAPL